MKLLNVVRSTFLALPPLLACSAAAAADHRVEVVPQELADAMLHNPDMGWVLYENYPLDQDPHGSSTLLTLPDEDFEGVDAVALMFTWQDVEQREGEYDFSKVDYAYDYWAKRGKEIQLRLSATTLLWWNDRTPPAGLGAPDYVRKRMPPEAKQTRTLEGRAYVVEDARNEHYRERLRSFLRAVDEHFSEQRPVTLIDLRGFGVWGEWHSGFQYATLSERHAALRGIVDLWADALPKRRLALSYSYDPDGPQELYAGLTKRFEPEHTAAYAKFLAYSAFDHALTRPNVTYRRDGCGGAVHSNERKLCEEAFQLGRGPMTSEFVDGYGTSKNGGDAWVQWKVEDALSLHPNYVNLLGYQGADARDFCRERPDLIANGLCRMGYRFVPTRVQYPGTVMSDGPASVSIRWVNRGVGRALRDYELELQLFAADGSVAARSPRHALPTSRWVAGKVNDVSVESRFDAVAAGDYGLGMAVYDPHTGRTIALPLAERPEGGAYPIGPITVDSP